MNHIDKIIAARKAGTPLILARTVEPMALIREVQQSKPDAAYVNWDICRGVVGLNESGMTVANEINGGEPAAMTTGNPVEALQRLLEFAPDNTVCFFHNAQLYIEGQDESRKPVIQAIWNLRDPFKASRRTLIMMAPDAKLPPELVNDVITVDASLPTKDDLEKIVRDTYAAAALTDVDNDVVDRGSLALLGLSHFTAEQIAAMSIRKTGLDVEAVWESKIAAINQVGGLKAERGGKSSFDNLFGLDNIVSFGRDLMAGEEPPVVIVLIDEVEKQLAGSNSDSSGTTQDQVGQILTCMEEYQWDGLLCPGFPGGGKTEFSKSLGAMAGLFVWLDLGGMKGQYVGQSEKAVRAAMQKLYAIGGSRVFFVCTCNSVANIPAPLYRRLTAGTYFFDFPTKEARKAMWKHYMKSNGLPDQPTPADEGWTGAEIKKACMWARRLRKPVIETAKRITPVASAMGKEVDELRKSASGKYLDAAADGTYEYKKQPITQLKPSRVISNN